MKIIKYNSCSDIDIEFENGYVSKNNTYQNFKKGQVRNYLIEYVFGVACLGQGKYIAYCEAKRPDLRSKTVAFRF